jgi:hypothetical protein
MPMLFGMIFGVLLTVAAAFAYDTGTGRAANGLPTSAANAPLVNWDVAGEDWANVKAQLRKASANVERGWKRITS